jgi:hypothetical protein
MMSKFCPQCHQNNKNTYLVVVEVLQDSGDLVIRVSVVVLNSGQGRLHLLQMGMSAEHLHEVLGA